MESTFLALLPLRDRALLWHPVFVRVPGKHQLFPNRIDAYGWSRGQAMLVPNLVRQDMILSRSRFAMSTADSEAG